MTNEELAGRLEKAEAEIQRLRGELIASRNVTVSIITDTLRARPEVAMKMITLMEAESVRLKLVPSKPFLKEGACRFYRAFVTAIRKSIGN